MLNNEKKINIGDVSGFPNRWYKSMKMKHSSETINLLQK